MLFNSSVIVHLCDLVTCYAALMYSHWVGPEYHICHTDEQILLLAILLYLPLWRTQETPFQSTCYVMTVDEIRVSSGNIDYVLTSRYKDYAATLLHIATWTSWHDRVAIDSVGNVHHGTVNKWHDLIVNWRNAPWSGNLDHQLINEPVILDVTGDS
jgi:hypothetical protein